MASSAAYRLLILGLLPLVAYIIYTEGQDYDPALIRFQSSESQADPMMAFFPDEITAFSKTGQIRTYTRDNLYEYVNGHAEYFISAGFTRLVVGEYSKGGAEGDEPDAVIDIYNMGKSIQAFGVLSDESGGKTRSLRTGAAGFRTQQGISFVSGQYYVKIAAYNETVDLDEFAVYIDRQIGSGTDPFPEFARLPDVGDVVQTRFVREAYRGLDFVNNVIEREYIVDGKTLQISLFTGEEGDIKKLVRSFMDFFRQSDIEYETMDRKGKSIYRVKDPYEGDWTLIPLPDGVFGVYGYYNDRIIDTVLSGSDDQG